jgi:hypothetical protein
VDDPAKLDYTTPQVRHRKWGVLPFVVLGLGVLGFLWIFLGYSLLGTILDNPAAADVEDAKKLVILMFIPACIGLLVGILVIAKRRKYEALAQTQAAVGTGLCVLQLLWLLTMFIR